MTIARTAILPILLALSACSGGEGLLSTASIFGNTPKPPPPAPTSDPTTRAFQVGTVTARAQKCGYNFDPAKLKASFLASEQALGATPEQMAQIEKVYGVALNGITKAAATQPGYCNEAKTRQIKTDLTRVLAGDYTPQAKSVSGDEEEEDSGGGGLFSDLGSSSGSSSQGVISKPSTANDY